MLNDRIAKARPYTNGERKEFAMRIKIITKMDWPSFRNVAVQISKALRNHCNCTIYDRTNAKPGGNILFIGTVFHQTLNFLDKFIGQSNIVFYGTTEGRSFVDEASLKVAKQIKIVAVSNFVKQMLEEIGVPVAGVVYHGLDMDDRRVDTQFYKVLKKKLKNKKIIFTASANHSRKGLNNLLYGYHIVEQEIKNTYLILHSEPTGYYNMSKMAKDLELKHLWLTNLYGKLSPSQLNAFYKLCSVYVQPSYSEGFGLPILEAFRFDKPVIAVDAPPFNEVIEHGKSGILVPLSKITWFNFANLVLFKMHMYRSEDLAHDILELMTNQQQITKMQEDIEKEKHNWSIHKLYPKLLDYFT
jgi:glycosyltransferase involved in cell wall biosynthesis